MSKSTASQASASQGSASTTESTASTYRRERIAHWDAVAGAGGARCDISGGYHRRLAEIYRFLIPPGQKVLELGCQQGDLLAELEPSEGVGVDFSPRMIEAAVERHPKLRFVRADAHDLDLGETFDAIILSDLVNDVWDVQKVLERVRRHCAPHTRVVINTYSRLWHLPLAAARRLGLAKPLMAQNWLTVEDVSNLLDLTDFEVVRNCSEVLLPLRLPLLAPFCNRFLVKLWPFRLAALTNFIIARPRRKPTPKEQQPVVSVVVPARNEAGHIEEIIQRTPDMGAGTELLFVEGGSKDHTWDAIQKAIAARSGQRIKAFRQTDSGKGDAVRLGFSRAAGDVLMILDADMTVAPEDLPRFYRALMSGAAEFVNGVRLVYPMEKRAMRFWNLMGNKFFSLAFSWILGQPVKDTLCGTKVMRRADYEKIASNRSYFGEFDPFGDFDLIFGAAKLNMKIIDMPIRYRERRYGETNIQRWRHGWILLKMVFFSLFKIKFV